MNILNGLIPEPSEIHGSLVGTRGPEGPQGPPGPEGPQGPEGPAGTTEWSGIDNKPFESIGANLSVDSEGRLNAEEVISDWEDITNKPFDSIGTGLTVENGVLSTEEVAPEWDTVINKPFETIGSGLVVNESTNELEMSVPIVREKVIIPYTVTFDTINDVISNNPSAGPYWDEQDNLEKVTELFNCAANNMGNDAIIHLEFIYNDTQYDCTFNSSILVHPIEDYRRVCFDKTEYNNHYHHWSGPPKITIIEIWDPSHTPGAGFRIGFDWPVTMILAELTLDVDAGTYVYTSQLPIEAIECNESDAGKYTIQCEVNSEGKTYSWEEVSDTWESISNKPFESVGSGLSVDSSGALNTDPVDYNDLLNKPTIPNATSDLTNDSGFITSADIPTDLSDFNNDIGFITGIDSEDVTDALGFTPYDATNPDGFITSSDIPTDISAFNNDEGYITNSVSDLENYTPNWDLASVATSGSYNDLYDQPTIPSSTSDLYNDSGFITQNDIPTDISAFYNDEGYITNTVDDLVNYTPSSDLASVATSGDYTDLSNTPTIPSATSDLVNDSDFITSSDIPDWGSLDNKPFDAIGNGLSVDSSGDLNVDPIDYSDIQNTPTIPDSTSDLVNDSGFITSADIPTDVSDFVNDAGYITSADLPDWDSLDNKPFESIGSGLSVNSEGVLSSTGGSGASDWDDLTNKPFETIGSGLSVDSEGELSVTGGGGAPEIYIGSSTPSGSEVLWINDTPTSVNVPQIDDAHTSLVDTWSSSKIVNEIPVIVALTQEEYDELDPPDPNTYYFIYEAESSE